MLFKEKLENHGMWLFRRRGYLPLLFLPVLALAFRDFSYPRGLHRYQLIWEAFVFSLSLFGLFIRCYTVGYTPKGTSGRHTKKYKAASLNTTGMYSITRNPLYFGNFFMMIGVVMFPRVWWAILIYILTFWLYYERIIMAEEAFLKDKFGNIYEEYCNRTPVFIPNLRLWQPPPHTFSLRKILSREYPGFFAITAAFTALDFFGDYMVQGTAVYDPVWITIFFSGATVFITLRFLKKKTRVLREHVD